MIITFDVIVSARIISNKLIFNYWQLISKNFVI